MAIPFELQGQDSQGIVHRGQMHSKDTIAGPIVFTEPRVLADPTTVPFINPTKGAQMAQNVGFSGIPTVIHAGVNSGTAESGTTDGATTSFKLIQSGQNFNTTVAVGHSVKNTTDTSYALVTAVDSDTQLTLDTDIMATGEDYEINQIWVGTGIIGTWDFAAAGKITLTNGSNNDEASFDTNAGQTWCTAEYTTLTGKVDLDTYSGSANSISLQFDLDGALVGDLIVLDDYIDTSDFVEQSFAIPVSDFNFGTDLINGMSIFVGRTTGPKPAFKLDDIQWEETGDVLEYLLAPTPTEVQRVSELIFSFVDNVTSIVTVAGATENSTIPGLSYNTLLGVSALTIGIGYRRVKDNKTSVSLIFKQLGDFLEAGASITNAISDGTNTLVSISVPFPDPVIMHGSHGDSLSITINDDLSTLISMKVFARGALEEESGDTR